MEGDKKAEVHRTMVNTTKGVIDQETVDKYRISH